MNLQLESGELLVLEATTNGEYCILPGTIVFDTTVTPLAFSFVDGQSCVTVDADFCPTAGTGDVTFDGTRIRIRYLICPPPLILSSCRSNLED